MIPLYNNSVVYVVAVPLLSCSLPSALPFICPYVIFRCCLMIRSILRIGHIPSLRQQLSCSSFLCSYLCVWYHTVQISINEIMCIPCCCFVLPILIMIVGRVGMPPMDYHHQHWWVGTVFDWWSFFVCFVVVSSFFVCDRYSTIQRQVVCVCVPYNREDGMKMEIE